MSIETLLRQRYSCRAFLPDPIDDDIIERIISTAQMVPSWCNAQPWQVIVTQKRETDRLREALSAQAKTAPTAPDIAFPTRYDGVYKDRRSICGWALYDAVGVAKGDRDASVAQGMQNFRLFGAPHMALITTPAALGAYGVLDCGAFVTAFTLAAQELDVASIPQAAVAAYAPFLHRWFEIPDDRHVVCAISFGRADKDHPANSFRTGRAPLEEVLSWR